MMVEGSTPAPLLLLILLYPHYITVLASTEEEPRTFPLQLVVQEKEQIDLLPPTLAVGNETNHDG